MQAKEKLPNDFVMLRPLLNFKENNIQKYIELNEIPYVNEPCQVADHKYKRLFFETLKLLGNKNLCNYDKLHDFLKIHKIKIPQNYEHIDTDTNFTDC